MRFSLTCVFIDDDDDDDDDNYCSSYCNTDSI